MTAGHARRGDEFIGVNRERRRVHEARGQRVLGSLGRRLSASAQGTRPRRS